MPWAVSAKGYDMQDEGSGATPERKAASPKAEPISREELYGLVWEKPMLRVAEELGVSSSYMARVCTELRVPSGLPKDTGLSFRWAEPQSGPHSLQFDRGMSQAGFPGQPLGRLNEQQRNWKPLRPPPLASQASRQDAPDLCQNHLGQPFTRSWRTSNTIS